VQVGPEVAAEAGMVVDLVEAEEPAQEAADWVVEEVQGAEDLDSEEEEQAQVDPAAGAAADKNRENG